MSETSAVGRPTVMTPENIAKLEDAFRYDLTDVEACFVAGIGKSSYYDYKKENPEFSDRIDAIKNSLRVKAKMNVAEVIIAGNVDESKWWLEHRASDQFSKRGEISGAGGGPIQTEANIKLTHEQLKEEAIKRGLPTQIFDK